MRSRSSDLESGSLHAIVDEALADLRLWSQYLMARRYRKSIEQFYCRGCGCLFDKNVEVYGNKVKCNQCAFVDMAPPRLEHEINRSGCTCATAALLASLTIGWFIWQSVIESNPLGSAGTVAMVLLAMGTFLVTGSSYFVGKFVGYVRHRKNY